MLNYNNTRVTMYDIIIFYSHCYNIVTKICYEYDIMLCLRSPNITVVIITGMHGISNAHIIIYYTVVHAHVMCKITVMAVI